jgi:hypothetical protein
MFIFSSNVNYGFSSFLLSGRRPDHFAVGQRRGGTDYWQEQMQKARGKTKSPRGCHKLKIKYRADFVPHNNCIGKI